MEDVFGTRFGDADLDGTVNMDDFDTLVMNFGSLDRGWADGDFDGDRVVQVSDFVLLPNHFGFQRPAPIAGIRRLLLRHTMSSI